MMAARNLTTQPKRWFVVALLMPVLATLSLGQAPASAIEAPTPPPTAPPVEDTNCYARENLDTIAVNTPLPCSDPRSQPTRVPTNCYAKAGQDSISVNSPLPCSDPRSQPNPVAQDGNLCYAKAGTNVPVNTRLPCSDTRAQANRVGGGNRTPVGGTVGGSKQPKCNDVQNNIQVCSVKKLGNGFFFFALILCILGIFISASLWALGSRGQNPGQELTGKRGIILCLTAAFLIGAYPQLTTFFNDRAGDVDETGITQGNNNKLNGN